MKIKQILAILGLSVFILVGCEKDTLVNHEGTSSSEKINHISPSELFKDKQFQKAVSKIPTKTQVSSLKTGKTVMEHEYGFTIEEFKPANVIETDSILSYTLLVTREQKSSINNIENLVINFNKFSQEVTALLIEYQSDEPITNFSNFTGNRKITPIVYNPTTYTNTTAKEYYECLKITIYVCANASETHIPGSAGCEAPPLVGYECSFLFDNDGGGNTSGTGTTTTSSTSTGSGSGVATSPVYTMSTLEKQRKTFTTSLSAEIKTWMADPVNANIKEALYSYLEYSNADTGDLAYMPQKCDFVKQYVTQTILTNLNLDLNYSLKSPAFIDFSSIDKNTPEGAKFTEVYNALIKSPTFKNLFINLFGAQDKFNIKFKIGPTVKPGVNGETSTVLINPILNTITISPSFLMGKSKIAIAKTIIHECIHAFLNVKLCDPNIGMSIPSINSLDLYNIINSQYNAFNGSQEQHNFIYNYLLPIMTQMISEVKNLLIPSSQIQNLEGLVVQPPSQTTTSPFSWNDFYLNLCLGGLQNCNFFQNEIGTISLVNGLPTVTNVVDPDKMYLYNVYNTYISIYLQP